MNKGVLNFIVEVVPIASFFLAYKLYGMMVATGVLIASSIFALVVQKIYNKKIPPMLLFTVVLVVIFGGITIISQNPHFIKMKPTAVYALFALILGIGLIRKKLYLKSVFAEKIDLSDYGWKILSMRFILFFLVMAISNEVVWRVYSEGIWINFKTFGVLPITLLFIISQTPFIAKHKG